MTSPAMPANFKKPNGSFYLSWIVLTSVSLPIAYLLCILILKLITNSVGDFIYVNGVRHITEDYLLMYVLVPIVSVLMGAFQYGLLRQYLPRMRGWILATMAGWFLGIFLIVFLRWLGWTAPMNTLDLTLLLMGLAIGLTQWLLLRNRLPQAGWWIAANVLGWGLLGWLTPGNSLDQYGVFSLGFLPACATALILALQLNRAPAANLPDRG
jgi:hypothetical protein